MEKLSGERHNNETDKKAIDIFTSPTDEDDFIDVENGPEVQESQFDVNRAKTLMTECERHMKVARPHTSGLSDEPINR